MNRKRPLRRFLPALFALLFISSVGVGAALMISKFMNAEPVKTERKTQTITLLTPPPPPPPPPEVKPPEPEVKEEVKIDEPSPEENMPDEPSDEPPPGDNLGLDAEGGAGGDSFGLIGRKGGRGLLDGAGGRFKYYASRLERQVENTLLDNKRVRRLSYSIVVRLWLRSDGHVARAELASSTGNHEVDNTLVDAITQVPPLAEAPPPDMPQPIRMRISSQL
jgi:protein TonB